MRPLRCRQCVLAEKKTIIIINLEIYIFFYPHRVYKKTSPNSVLTLYLGTRDVVCRQGAVEPLRGVIYIDPKFVPSHKIYGQLTLTFRYAMRWFFLFIFSIHIVCVYDDDGNTGSMHKIMCFAYNHKLFYVCARKGVPRRERA